MGFPVHWFEEEEVRSTERVKEEDNVERLMARDSREERQPKPTLKVAAHGSKLIGWVPPMLPRQMNDWIVASGLSSLQHTSLARIDTHLLSAFVERWHPETSSFHMSFGEMTITLDDVSCLLHVPIRGELVDPDVVVTDYDAIHLAVELFGVSLSDATAEASTVRGPYYKLDWLKQIFEQQRAANNFTGAMRAYMMLLLGCTILADKTFTLVEAKYLNPQFPSSLTSTMSSINGLM
ncbi:protein MAIN-LIKE 1-like [Vicia villosa]|uniref:protein MAIN-LIKE 1-like n=1 Tax=Vicia villosa TaxID=3911 RepID=UPI00273B605A|nr:protein MAIN-LIKE 1-like [Vicia villosa]